MSPCATARRRGSQQISERARASAEAGRSCRKANNPRLRLEQRVMTQRYFIAVVAVAAVAVSAATAAAAAATTRGPAGQGHTTSATRHHGGNAGVMEPAASLAANGLVLQTDAVDGFSRAWPATETGRARSLLQADSAGDASVRAGLVGVGTVARQSELQRVRGLLRGKRHTVMEACLATLRLRDPLCTLPLGARWRARLRVALVMGLCMWRHCSHMSV